jgi:tripartite-type tricarboxylate transporter receptor subunit TctC
MRTAIRAWVAAGMALAAVTAAQAQAPAYPTRPVKIIVPFPAGGPLDVLGRAMGDKLAASLRQPFLIENRVGASGNTGSDAAAKSAPDGYTLLLVLSSTLTVNPALYQKMPFDPEKDLRLITIATSSSQLLVVHPSLPVHSVKEFVAFASKEPIAYAHAGPGSPGHLIMEFFRMYAGFKAQPVPYRGNALLVNDLIAGQIKAGFVGSGGLFQHVRDGRVRALAISSASERRSPLLPDVPSIVESGYPQVKYGAYFVLAAPAGVPDDIAALIEREARAALQAPEIKDKLRAIDIAVMATSSAEAKSILKAEADTMARVVKATGMRID